MTMISEFNDGKLGNYIMIDNNFTYRKNAPVTEEGIDLPEVRTLKIGYNKNDVRKQILIWATGPDADECVRVANAVAVEACNVIQ